MKQWSGYGCICELWKLLWCNRWMEQLLTDSCSAVWRRSVNKRHGSSFRHSLVTLAWFCSSWSCGYSVCLGIYRQHTAPPVHCSCHYTAWKALAYTQVDTWMKWQISGGAELIWIWASKAGQILLLHILLGMFTSGICSKIVLDFWRRKTELKRWKNLLGFRMFVYPSVAHGGENNSGNSIGCSIALYHPLMF